jgi:two-component system, sensor histidine kinase PdtaS
MSFIKGLFTPKIGNYIDIFENTRFLLSYRLTLFLSIALFILSIFLFFFFSIFHFTITLVAFVACVLSFIAIYKTGKYKTFIFTFNLIGAFLCVFTLYFANDQPRIVDGLWMVVSSMFSFLTLGKKWGSLITITHGLAMSIFFIFFLNEQIDLMKHMTIEQSFGMSMNIIICFSIIYYLNWQNIKSNLYAEKQINESKNFLEEQFDVTKQQNDEKTVLLKEIHHRVKNNLQVIVSLLRLQSRDIEDPNELKKFTESINRVLAMSLIHEKIYQTEDFSKIDLKDYFTTLANDMIRTFQVDKKIELDINCKVEDLGLNPIVPIALIFNELLSNSIKYAFTEVNQPKISVYMNHSLKNFIEFTYADNGIWKEKSRDNSFGLELIETLTEQLNGHFEVFKTNGTKYTFYFEKINS